MTYCTCLSSEDLETECPRGIHVSCDDRCDALVNPVTVEELRAALEHWRDHGYISGCSHGR